MTWGFFYVQDLPLDPASTSFVVVAWATIAGIVPFCWFLFSRLTFPKRMLLAGMGLVGVGAAIWLIPQWIDHIHATRIGGLPRVTGRDILYTSRDEASGYALYSYILFRGAATSQNEDRYIAALTAFLDEIPEIRELIRRRAKRSELNIAYILLKEQTTGAKQGDTVTGEDLPRVWLGEYDFARARLLLRAVPDTTQDGPYIVSYDRPLSTIDHRLGREDLLLQNLSLVPAPLIRVWVKEFLRQASQPGAFAKEDLWRQLTLKVRTGIEVAAQGLPEVETAWAHAKEQWTTAVKPVKPEFKTK
jgi:hypothetical protein